MCTHVCIWVGTSGKFTTNTWLFITIITNIFNSAILTPYHFALSEFKHDYQIILFTVHLKSCHFANFHGLLCGISAIMEESLGDLCVFCIEFHVSGETLNSDPALTDFSTFATRSFTTDSSQNPCPCPVLFYILSWSFPPQNDPSPATSPSSLCSFSLSCMPIIYRSGAYHVSDFVRTIATSNSYNLLKARLLIVWQLFLHS